MSKTYSIKAKARKEYNIDMGGNKVFSKAKLIGRRNIEKREQIRVKELNRIEEIKNIKTRKSSRYDFISKKTLEDLYLKRHKSIREISEILEYSNHKINYWMLKYNILTRNQSEAMYAKKIQAVIHLLFQNQKHLKNRPFAQFFS